MSIKNLITDDEGDVLAVVDDVNNNVVEFFHITFPDFVVMPFDQWQDIAIDSPEINEHYVFVEEHESLWIVPGTLIDN